MHRIGERHPVVPFRLFPCAVWEAMYHQSAFSATHHPYSAIAVYLCHMYMTNPNTCKTSTQKSCMFSLHGRLSSFTVYSVCSGAFLSVIKRKQSIQTSSIVALELLLIAY